MSAAREELADADASRAFYDRISRVYDALADRSEHEARSRGVALVAPQPGERALEIGFGTGHCLVTLAREVGEEGRVVGVDLSPGMHAVAGARLEEAGLRGRIELHVGDARDLPLEDASFDLVFMSFALELFSEADIGRVLTEVRRVLAPAGRLGLVAMAEEPGRSLPVEIFKWMHRHFPHIVDCRPIAVERLLREAGFEPVSSESVAIWGLPVRVLVARVIGPPESR